MNHFPGPWFAVNYSGFWEIQKGPDYTNGCILNEDCFDNAEANAKLAAAAPELLEALKILLAGLNKNIDMYSKEEKIKIAEAAIKKAIN